MLEEILSCILFIGISFLAFLSIRTSIFDNGKRTDKARDELAEAGESQQNATREATGARETANHIRQSTTELKDATRTSQSIIEECKSIIDEIRQRNDINDIE